MRQLYSRRTETLDYLQSMLGQMRTMAQAERCDMLSYLIEMAYVEVSDIIRGERPARVTQDKQRGAQSDSEFKLERLGDPKRRPS
jgi:hypothetical protein